jgi:uncharacterized membrane protein YeaQ/YmgE (transglycosylase-associated protein family)
MIGMDFISFLILLVISLVVSAVLHFGLKYYITPGWASFFCKIAIGWVGAWLGSPVFGYWIEGLNYKQLYIIPAILGSLAILIFAVDMVKTCASTSRKAKEPPSPNAP